MVLPMDSMAITLLAWPLAMLLDFFYGEYPNRFHPVVWMGRTISWGEKIFLGRGRKWEFLGGCLMVLVIPSFFAFFAWKSIDALSGHFLLQLLLATFWLKASFALNALGAAAQEVRRHLISGDIQGARQELRSLCSRNADQLSEEELTEASISSLAENLSDSVIAPWFFAALFGVPGAIFYRAINTMDAMIGYKNHFRHLGCAAARTDDLLNFVPARLTTLFLLGAGALQRLRIAARIYPSIHQAWIVTYRDHGKTPSPNGGWPMASMAGLLGISLRKGDVYTLGIRRQPSELHLMGEAWRLASTAAWLAWPMFLLMGAIR